MRFKLQFIAILVLIFFHSLLFARQEKISDHFVVETESIPLEYKQLIMNQLKAMQYEVDKLIPHVFLNNIFYLAPKSLKKVPHYRVRGKEVFAKRVNLDYSLNKLDNKTLRVIMDLYIQSKIKSPQQLKHIKMGMIHTPEWILSALMYRTSYYSPYPIKSNDVYPLLRTFYLNNPAGRVPDPVEIVGLPLSSNDGVAYEVYGELCNMLLTYHQQSSPSELKNKLLLMLRETNVKNPNSTSLYQRHLQSLIPRVRVYLPYSTQAEYHTEFFPSFCERVIYEDALLRDVASVKIAYQTFRESIIYAEQMPVDTEYALERIPLKSLGLIYHKVFAPDALKMSLSHQLLRLRAQSPYRLRFSLAKIGEHISALTIDNCKSFEKKLLMLESQFYDTCQEVQTQEAHLDMLQKSYRVKDLLEYKAVTDYFERNKIKRHIDAELWFSAIERRYLRMLAE